MPLDFTFAAFDAFCQRAAHMPVFKLGDYLARSALPPTPYLILRVDVDYREPHAIQLARIAAHYNLRGTFFVRYHPGGFDLKAIQTIAALGHEIGYHYETLDTCQGDTDCATATFLDHIAQLRATGFKIRTAAAHGSPPTDPTYHGNLDLLAQNPDLLDQAGLIGEATLSVDFTQVAYISDANWRWRRYSNYAPGHTGRPTSLHATMNDLARPDAGLYINFHPHQWFAHPATLLYYRARNRIGRYALPIIRKVVSRIKGDTDATP